MVRAQTCSGEKRDKTFSAQNHKVAAKYVEMIPDVLHLQNVYIRAMSRENLCLEVSDQVRLKPAAQQ